MAARNLKARTRLAKNSWPTNRIDKKRLAVEELEARMLLAGLWSYIDQSVIPTGLTSFIRAEDYKLATLDSSSLRNQLAIAPTSLSQPATESSVISIPKPDGTLERFNLYVTAIMAPELAARFPEIQTYAGQGIDNPSSTVFFDLTPQGFHAQVRSPEGTYYVDPYSNVSSDFYAVYANGKSTVDTGFRELEADLEQSKGDGVSLDKPPANNGSNGGLLQSRSGAQLRTYRLAVGATGEYTIFHGGTVALGQAAIVTAINRVGGIYQTELSIAFQIVANNDKLVFTDPATDGYSNNNGGAMLGENQTKVDSIIGNANYDIGHVFSTGGGGVASLGSVGINSRKAQGVTGLPTPIGDAFYVDYVSHEMGHQFGGNHTFNSSAGSCGGGNRNASTAYEPGSGASIQAYAGICGTDDLQPNSDPYFHSASLDEIVTHVDTIIPKVGTRVVTGNNIPVINAGADYTIPAGTPFVLTAIGSDADPADKLTFDWQQRDLGPTQALTAADNGTSPLFRTWVPSSNPSRTFPRLSDLVNNTTAKGERLPTTTRQMNFRVVARDNRAAGGAFDDDNMRISVIDTGTPFAVVTPNTNVSWEGLTFQTINWTVAGTTGNGINALSVDISMSTDGGLTYPFALASSVANNGSASVRIPNTPTSNARVRVQGSNNIFFDISDTNFTITPATIVIDLNLGSGVTYVENSAAILVAPTAKVTNLNVSTYAGGVLTAAIGNNFQSGDSLDIASQGSGAGEISVVGTLVAYGGTPIGTYSGPGQSINVTFNAAANRAAIERLLTRVSFVHTTDDPSPNPREITAFLDNGQNGASNKATVLLDVVPVNDAPTSSDVSLAPINEDTKSPAGIAIGLLIVPPLFMDPDRGSSLSGIAITSNNAVITDGQWQYSVDAVNWLPVGSVVPAGSLVLSSSSRIRFLSAKDYFGSPTPLTYRALDETYSGGFTTTLPLILDVSAATIIGPVSLADKSIGIPILPVNDAPITTVSSQATSVNQDVPLIYQIQTSWFTDVDNATLTHSIKSGNGASLPAWLSFNPLSKRLTGTPSNDDVGTYDLVIQATDAGGLFTTLKLQLLVINVNDAPTNIELVGNSVRENDFGVFIGTLFGTDKDRSDKFTWQVSDQRFAIQGNMLFLAPGIRLNYEVTPRIDLQITVTDNGTLPGPLSLTLQKTIDVLDVNEFSPSLKATLFNVNESALPLSEIGFLTAPDGDTSNRVRYRFNGTSPSLFSLDGTTGRIALKQGATLDHESVSSFQFFVEAFDDGLPELGTVATVNVTVTDFNEFDPQITNGVISISERQVTQVPFAKLTATDGDTSQSVRFFLPNSETRFSVNSTSGELSLNRPGLFDFEANSTDSIVVIAQDNGTPPRSVQRTLSLVILDANDPPTAASVANPSILSNVSGLPLGRVSIVDQDSSQLYTIISSDDRFVIVGENLFVAPGKAVNETDPLQLLVPIVATEIGSDGKSYALNIGLNRIPNTHPWQNRLNPLDVNRDDNVDPRDVLAIINFLNGSVVTVLPLPRPASTLSLPDYDVDGEGTLNPLDVLAIINFINGTSSGEGEARRQTLPSATIQTALEDAAWLTAYTQIEEERLFLRRRRG